MATAAIRNPFRPGAGHMPPYLAGRDDEQKQFQRLLDQDVVLENLILTGLRGVGKTVLLETLKPLAQKAGWLWVGTDVSESATMSEEGLALRLMTDVAVVTSTIVVATKELRSIGFSAPVKTVTRGLDFALMKHIYDTTPGLASDKLKAVIELVWSHVKGHKANGIVFAYDEAQVLGDHADTGEYPLSLLLDVFQSIQRKNVPFMLVLTGLPTLFAKLVEARTYSERMFRSVTLTKLDRKASLDAIQKPINEGHHRLPTGLAEEIATISSGYPYFIQFLSREIYDVCFQQAREGKPVIPIAAIVRKLDTDFYAGRWARVTDRQRELLTVIAHLSRADEEFTVQEIVAMSTKMKKKLTGKPFSPSHTNQILSALTRLGLVFKNRHGRYSFAVPLLGQFIRRQEAEPSRA
jgi:hypothetical protein